MTIPYHHNLRTILDILGSPPIADQGISFYIANYSSCFCRLHQHASGSAAPSSLEPGELVISAIESMSGSRSRAPTSGASQPLTIEELAALQED